MSNSDRRQTVPESELGRHLRQRLDEQSTPLPPHVLLGLRKARIEALAQAGKENRLASWLSRFSLWKPAASFATALVLVITVAYFDGSTPVEPLLVSSDIDAELLFSEEDFQLYDDLDFYRWLANNELQDF